MSRGLHGGGAAEGDGWVNWMGLATLLSALDVTHARAVSKLAWSRLRALTATASLHSLQAPDALVDTGFPERLMGQAPGGLSLRETEYYYSPTCGSIQV